MLARHVSLWKVADQSTAELMIPFYKRLRDGVGKAEALRQAQLEMIRKGRFRSSILLGAVCAGGPPLVLSFINTLTLFETTLNVETDLPPSELASKPEQVVPSVQERHRIYDSL